MGKRIIESNELKKIENEILIYIKEVCERENIMYYLSGGTVLGAVRHGGFIPWDDDIDLYMYRKDYQKFTEVMRHSDPRFKLLYLDTDRNYTLPLPKVIDTRTILTQLNQIEKEPIGVYVDVFILDNVPDDEQIRHKYINKMRRLIDLWTFAQCKDSGTHSGIKGCIYKIIRNILWAIGPRFFAVRLDKMAKKYYSIETEYCGNITYSPNVYKAVTKKDIYGKGAPLLFEGIKYNAPQKVDEYLRHLYGDYMEFPPVDERVSHHDFVAYYKE